MYSPDGILVSPATFTVLASSSNVYARNFLLLFDTSASALKKIQVSNVSPSKSSGTATGDGSPTAFTINSGRSVNDVLVVVNGIVMVPTTDYQISGTTLTFQGSAPASGAEIVFRYI